MIWYIDRIENGIAVLQAEDGTRKEAVQALLPEGCREGGVLVCRDGVFQFCTEKETERKRQLFLLLNNMLGKEGPQGRSIR